MKTISKNARLSVTALVFGAALMSCSNAFGMSAENEKSQIEFMRDYLVAQTVAITVNNCYKKALETNKHSTVSPCLEKAEQEFGVPLTVFNRYLAFTHTVSNCQKATQSGQYCEALIRDLGETSRAMAERLDTDPNFANN